MMGDNIVEAQAREIVARFTGEVQQVINALIAERDQLHTRVQELTHQVAQEREARRKEKDLVEAYRRDYQKLYVKAHPPTEEDIEFWRKAKPSDFPYSWDDIQAMIDEVAKEHGIRE